MVLCMFVVLDLITVVSAAQYLHWMTEQMLQDFVKVPVAGGMLVNPFCLRGVRGKLITTT